MMASTDELPWIEELYDIVSLPRLEILRQLWGVEEPIDTFSISKAVHLSMEETYGHLSRLEELGLVEEMPRSAEHGKKLWKARTKDLRLEIVANRTGIKYNRTADEAGASAPRGAATIDKKKPEVQGKTTSQRSLIVFGILLALLVQVGYDMITQIYTTGLSIQTVSANDPRFYAALTMVVVLLSALYYHEHVGSRPLLENPATGAS
jgi:DNA-binding transcriptional ArsR family regulator